MPLVTIAAAFLTGEGIVLGADSTTTVVAAGQGVAQLFNNAQKVFEVGIPGAARFALATWGNGVLGNLTHRQSAATLAGKIGADTTLDGAVAFLVEIAEQAGALASPLVGYFLGGTDPGSCVPRCFKIIFADGKAIKTELQHGQVIFEGMPDFFTRMFYGFDPKLPGALINALLPKVAGKLPDAEATQMCVEAVNEALATIPRGFAAHLPLRDAIDFVHTYLHLTIKAFKFRMGPPVCGGAIEIGFVSADRPFRWVCHKKFDSAIYQTEGVL
jgi:hypothetical protein